MGVMYVKTVRQLKRREGACGLGRKERWQVMNLGKSAEAQQDQQHQQQDKELQAYTAHVVLISGKLIA
jgi:hypothetical protein